MLASYRPASSWALAALLAAGGFCVSSCSQEPESERLRAIAEQHEVGDEAALKAMAKTIWGTSLGSASLTERDGERILTLGVLYGDRPDSTLDAKTFTSSTLRHLAASGCKMVRWSHRRKVSVLVLSVSTRTGNHPEPVELYRVRLPVAATQRATESGCTPEVSAQVRASWHVELDRTDRLKMHAPTP
ncbi:MAG: hypothetical protein JRI23_03710 [Deltaproteobacteria bacterium]|nr:hypothetical protein [Deltaproteobacteria bacterium]MBW2530625.1 hypothetical protein [Deltaproteobacteria bacterium]